jgi:uncharacterized protein (DUF1800 family)
MDVSRRIQAGVLAAVAMAAVAVGGTKRPSAAAIPTDDKTIAHVLNRVAFGPRPGDVDRVREMGVERYLDEQLHPERIPDKAMDDRLASLETITMSSREIADKYAIPLQQARRQQKQSQNQKDGQPPDPAQPSQRPPAMQQANQVLMELSAQKVERAVYSDRQLQEVLVDFWFNHFNVDARKGPDRFLLTEYERETIRPHVLGSFRSLLEATAKSPAMLFYLDNWMSVDPEASSRRMGRGRFAPLAPPQATAQNPRRGLNENYARELMELHTLGVDGGYTQKDVTEVARAFTGWTIDQPRRGGGFRFEPRLHDDGPKVILGHHLAAGGGERDGEQVLDILASHPSTARFISTELAGRFVSDSPPAALVERTAATFTRTHGDLREVMRTILTSPEFYAEDSYRAKVKTPFEFVVSSVRALGVDAVPPLPLVRALQQLGQPLYQCQPPTGYKDTADAWVNTGALVERMNIALQLTGANGRQAPAGFGRQSRATRRQLPVFSPGSGSQSDAVIAQVLANDISDATRATIAKATTEPQRLALTLGSPEFQRR